MDAIETLSHGAVVVSSPGWGDEQPSEPSKRELLEQILAEQRKTNKLLQDIVTALKYAAEGRDAPIFNCAKKRL